jgi:hypothetical protein
VGNAKRERETGEYLAMLRRMLRAGARRIADADPEDLAEMVALRAELDEAITKAVQGMHDNGFSWAEIAAPLGISRVAAFKRWSKKVEADNE